MVRFVFLFFHFKVFFFFFFFLLFNLNLQSTLRVFISENVLGFYISCIRPF